MNIEEQLHELAATTSDPQDVVDMILASYTVIPKPVEGGEALIICGHCSKELTIAFGSSEASGRVYQVYSCANCGSVINIELMGEVKQRERIITGAPGVLDALNRAKRRPS
jgi:DNA-directed RNA polymerase subunit RPC12/RpoP